MSRLLTLLRGQEDIPRSGLVAFYAFGGPDHWWQPDRNLLLWSEDITNAAWVKTDATADDATHLTFTAQNGNVYQNVATLEGVLYTFSFKIRRITGSTSLHFRHTSSVSGNITALTIDDTLTRYKVTVLGQAGGGNVMFGIFDTAAAGHGQVEITDLMVIPGSHTTAECEALYQKTEAKHVLHDWSGNGRHGERGSDPGNDANDPSITPSCRNLLAAGSTEDLEDAAWTLADLSGGASVDSATQLTLGTNSNDRLTQNVTTVEGVSYALSADVTLISGSNTIRLAHISSATGQYSSDFTITSTPTRYSVTVLGRAGGGVVSFGVVADSSSPTSSTFTVTEWQVEAADAATDYINPATEALVSGWDFVTDDYVVTDPLTLDSDWTFLAVLQPDDNTSVGLFRNGASSPNVSLDESGRVSYAGGGTVAANNAVGNLEWRVIAITKSGTTITHYLDGEVNGSGTSGSGNAFAALRIGYDGTAYYDGEYGALLVYDRALAPGTIKRVWRELLRRWDYDHQGHREMHLEYVRPWGFDAGFDSGFTI